MGIRYQLYYTTLSPYCQNIIDYVIYFIYTILSKVNPERRIDMELASPDGLSIIIGIFMIIYIIICLALLVLTTYILILGIKALKIYIKKNS